MLRQGTSFLAGPMCMGMRTGALRVASSTALATTSRRMASSSTPLNRVQEFLRASKGVAEGSHHYYMFNLGSKILAVTLPAGLIVSSFSSLLAMPFDLVTGLLIPAHAHVGMRHVITDYVPRGYAPAVNRVLPIFTLLATLGFLKYNLVDQGISNGLRQLWKAPVDKDLDK
ncbi:hypothetical protein QOT17_009604 [Balamuthia mandrillaris]